ncbi:MAG: hypothetical protein RIF32_12690 [Leptospirales bacterium]
MANKKIARAGTEKTTGRTKTAASGTSSKKKAKPKSPAASGPSRTKRKTATDSPQLSKASRQFQKILATLSGTERNVQAGRMMSSPGIVRNGKVFAFFWNDEMVFRLGKGFDPSSLNVAEWRYLNPFKGKPPMKGWFVVPPTELKRWDNLARAALDAMRREQEK